MKLQRYSSETSLEEIRRLFISVGINQQKGNEVRISKTFNWCFVEKSDLISRENDQASRKRPRTIAWFDLVFELARHSAG